MDKVDASMMTTVMTTIRTLTTKERDGNLPPPGEAAQRNGRGLPQMGTNDGNGGASDNDGTQYNNSARLGGEGPTSVIDDEDK